MKRIVAFVILGIVIYAGIYILVYGIRCNLEFSDRSIHDFNTMSSNGLEVNIMVSGEVYSLSRCVVNDQFYDYVHVDKISFFGITISGGYNLRIFLAEMGKSEKLEDRKYCMLAIRDDDTENLEIAKQLLNDNSDDVCLRFSGVVKESDFIRAKQSNIFEAAPDERILPYIIYVGTEVGAYESVIIVGGAVTLVGAALTMLLILKIKHDRESY